VFEFSEDSNTNSGAFSSLSPSSAGTGLAPSGAVVLLHRLRLLQGLLLQ
jgi:hypothetical protein